MVDPFLVRAWVWDERQHTVSVQSEHNTNVEEREEFMYGEFKLY